MSNSEKKATIHEIGFGGLLQLRCDKLHMLLCLWMIDNVNVTYQQLEISNASNIQATCTHVGHIFRLPTSGENWISNALDILGQCI